MTIQKQLLLLVSFTIVIVIFVREFKMLFYYCDNITTFIEIQLTAVFQPTPTGSLLRKTITLMLPSLILTAAPAAIYWGIKRKLLPGIYYMIWIIWLVAATKINMNGFL